jgi:hypothetical protein
MKPIIDTELEVAALGILGVLILEIVALLKGVDGIMFGAAMVAIGTIIGWVFKTYRVKSK